MQTVSHEYAHSQMVKALELTREFCNQNDCSYDFWENSVPGKGDGHYSGLNPTSPYRQMRLRLLVKRGESKLLTLTRWCGLVGPILSDAQHYTSDFGDDRHSYHALCGNAYQYHYIPDGKHYGKKDYFADKKFCIWRVDYERMIRETGWCNAHFVISGQEGGSPDWGFTPYMVEMVAGPFKSQRKLTAKIEELDPEHYKPIRF
jgi:hypothetical protein